MNLIINVPKIADLFLYFADISDSQAKKIDFY